MTSDGSDPPSLPPGDDPYELLGIAPDASDRDIRKAYAKRIKVFRPDRSPAEFQRIQRAFEWLGSGARAEAPRAPAPAEEKTDRDADEEAARAGSAELATALTAFTAGDRQAADQIIGALLVRRVPIDQLMDDPDYHAMILDSAALRWAVLDPRDPARLALWMQAFHRAANHDLGRACALLDDDALRLDAADDPELAVHLLRWLGGLGWQGATQAGEILDRYRARLPAHPAVDDALERATLDCSVSKALRDKYLPPVVRPLPPLIVASRIGSSADQATRARELAEALAVDVKMSLEQLDGIVSEQMEVYDAINEIIAHDLPARRRRLDQLSERRFAHLTRALHAAGKRERPLLVTIAGSATVFGVIAAVAPALAIIVAIVGGAYLLYAEDGRYKKEIRHLVALAILTSPVDSNTASRWVKLNGKLNGRLGRFDVGIDNDHGLYLFSVLASYAAEVGELDARLDRDD